MSDRKLQTMLIVLIATLLLSLAAGAEDEKKPDGTVEIEAEQFALIITGVHGNGTLHYQGQAYHFKLKSGGLGASVAVSKMSATGEVYDLKDINDFPGIYTTAQASAALGEKGIGAVYIQNNKGVVMRLRARSEGIALTLGQDVVDIKLDQ